MSLLTGTVAPPGDGMVVEVHLDIVEAHEPFLKRLRDQGFENDPFLQFNPAEYTLHYTGRMRASKTEMKAVLTEIAELVDKILGEAFDAGIDLYAETELVREIRHFESSLPPRDLSALDGLSFKRSLDGNHAKADVHVEFRCGTVPPDLRDLLIEKNFYWVVTPASERFPSEEIATLQTATFQDASLVFSRLVKSPLPACTGIHLEQKIAMLPSRPGLSMPPVTCVRCDANAFAEQGVPQLIEMAI